MALDDFLRARDVLLQHRADYASAVLDFAWPVLDRFNWALDYFTPLATGNERRALWIVGENGDEQTRSFAELDRRSNQVANFLRNLGVRRGDRLILMLGNDAALWETFLACTKLGAVVIPATTLLSAADVHDRIERGRAKHVVVDASAPVIEAIPGELTRISVGDAPNGWIDFAGTADADPVFVPDGETRASDPLLLYFTSGTTAKPKLVLHTHQSYPAGHLSTMYWIGVRPGDVHWNISSPGWAKHAWSSIFAPLNAGATIFALNYNRFQPRRILDALTRYEITTLCAPPTVWRLLVQEPLHDVKVRLREVLSAGEPLNPEVIDRIRAAWGLTIRDGYGQTETTAIIGNSPGQPLKPGSMGRPLPGYRVHLIDDDGHEGDEGEICVATSSGRDGVMQGYADGAPAASATDGLYHTGDIASRDADGYFTFVGRTDDVFKASDYRISPFELESALLRHPSVAEAAVVPSPDPLRHAVPKAFIVLAKDYTPTRELAGDIFTFVRATVAPYLRVRRLEFRDLPKTISGKIRRVELRRLEQERRGSPTRAPLEFFEEDC